MNRLSSDAKFATWLIDMALLLSFLNLKDIDRRLGKSKSLHLDNYIENVISI